MAELPEATVTIDDEAGALAGGTDLLTVIAAVSRNADSTPRIFASTKALLAKHDYAPGVDYCAMHFEEARKPVLFIGVPIVSVGAISRIDQSGNTNSSVVTAAAGTSGILEEVDAVVKCAVGGVVATDQIVLDISLDGGRTFKKTRLGTEVSLTLPYVGLDLNFAAGSLTAGDTVLKFSTSAPRWDSSGLSDARDGLVAQQKQARSWLVIGDLLVEDDADDVLDEVNGYETANTRYVFVRGQVRDRKVLSFMSKVVVRMTGSPSLTFAEVGATGDTVTRSTGSFVNDGFVAGDYITVAGSVSNNVSGKITAVTALVLTLDTADLVAEGPVAGCSIIGTPSITFAEVGASADTITRSRGSWLADGFAAGDEISVTGSVSNNISAAALASVTATVLTLGTTDLAAEVIGSRSITVQAGELDSDWVSDIDEEFGDVDAQRRIDLGAGRGRKTSPIHGWKLRRPFQWAASIREYQHDVQIPTWRKSDGPCKGWDLEDEEGNTVEHDERIDGGLLAARFSCFRTYANGPAGAFVALSLTRAAEGSLLSRTHNMAVADIACSVCQAETENAIGQVLELTASGTGTEASLVVLEERVNTALAIALLQSKSEGKRASDAKWKASRTDILNIPEAELTGTLDLRLNGTLEKITTRVRVQTAG
jgi:hypothetical protein